MSKRMNYALSLILSVVLVLAMLAGCSKKEASPPAAGGETATSNGGGNTGGQTGGGTAGKDGGAGPQPVTLTTIAVSSANIDPLIDGDLANRPLNKELTRLTGVTIKYTMTTNSDYDTKLNLLISSGDAPDFFGPPSNYPGGMVKMANDGLIVDLSQYLDTDLPNLKRLFDEHPEWRKEAFTDDGRLLAFPRIMDDKRLAVFAGPMVRKDLLDKANLPIPETLDDWHTMLKAFKDLGVKNPYMSLLWFPYYTGDFAGAFGANGRGYEVILKDGKAVYGPIEPGYKDYLAMMHQWYEEGLIDPDFVTNEDWGLGDTKMISGESAATTMFVSKLSEYPAAGKQTNPDYEIVAAPHPVLRKGDTPYLGQMDNLISLNTVINAKSKHLKEMLRFFDWGYSEEGKRFWNYGIEGESYTIVNGVPTFTDAITNNPNGWTKDQAIKMYTDNNWSIQDLNAFNQLYAAEPQQQDAIEKWSNFQVSTLFPNITPTEEEVEVIKGLADINTYSAEMTAKFILGTEPIENFDKYVEHIKSMGIDEILAAENKALERYNNR
jgi:putative aldouronate transport system substrate-binding protein